MNWTINEESLAEKLRKQYEGHTKFPWKTAPGEYGCKIIKGNKFGAHKQAQYHTKIAWTEGLSNEEEDAANARLMADIGGLFELLELTIVACEVTVNSCTNCYQGFIYHNNLEDGPVSECQVCTGAHEALVKIDRWLK